MAVEIPILRGDVDDVLVSTLTSLAKALGLTREDLLAGIPEDEDEEHLVGARE
jgi:hypothetical protein